MLSRLALAALVALPLGLTACDAVDDTPRPIIGVRVTGASLIDLDFTNPDGGSWDGGLAGGPDVYLRVFINDVEVRNTEDRNDLDNLLESELPAAFTEFDNSPLTLNNLTQHLRVEVWDDDGSDDELIAVLPTTAIQSLADSQQPSLNLTDGQTLVRLQLSYVR